MGKLQTKRQMKYLIWLCVGVYFFSYLTRINYAAIIVELISSEGITKSSASVVTTVAFITYGVGQLLSGYLGDRLSPRWLIFYGYLVTVGMNFLMPFLSDNISAMAIVWGINGVAQAFMWPPLVKIMTSALPDEIYSKAVPFIGMGSAAATIAVYLFSPIIIELFNWKYVFYIFAGCAFIASFVWISATKKILQNVTILLRKRNEVKKDKTSVTDFAGKFIKFLPIIIISIAVQGILRDGISTWVPTFFSETFKLKSTVAILTGIALPIFHVACSLIAYKVLKLFNDRVFFTISVYFAVISLLLVLLYTVGVNYIFIALFLLSAVSGLIHSVNLYQTAYIPKFFTGVGSASIVCGLMNFSTYIGSALSTYIFAIISDAFGWNMTILSWIAFAVFGLLISLFIYRVCEKNKVTA